MLRQLSFKSVYKTEYDNILSDLYIPAFSIASRYDRAVGFFSAATISSAAQGITRLIKNDGRIRLIVGAFTDEDDIEAISKGYDLRTIAEKIGNEFLDQITGIDDSLFEKRLDALAWLVSRNRMDVKVALRAKGMYHEKIGIISDITGDSLVFTGSSNESIYALLPSYNYESISVYPTWKAELKDYFQPHIDGFARLWANKERNTAVIDIPSAVKDNLLKRAKNLTNEPTDREEVALWNAAKKRHLENVQTDELTARKPVRPEFLNGYPFSVREHQRNALKEWQKNNYIGILALATGAGKTVTAIESVVKLSERINNLTVVIAVPYQNLADQWCDILNEFNIWPLHCYESRANWLEPLKEIVHEIKLGARTFTCIVVVNRTLKTKDFQECIADLRPDKFYWIGDECHHHGSISFADSLPLNSNYRLGLSATPDHYLDEDKNKRLKKFYGDVVYEYSLEQAIQEKILTPYRYHVSIVEFTDDEAQEFLDLCEKIGNLFSRNVGSSGVTQEDPILAALLRKRSRLVGSARGKMVALEKLIVGQRPTKHTLFYCGDGTVSDEDVDNSESDDQDVVATRQIDLVTSFLAKHHWHVSRFTARESRKDRERILGSFKVGAIDAMVAIRCLDEGIDVPACSTAYILASSRDPRQFIQRRGRILRRSPGKDCADIYDFVVILPKKFESEDTQAKKLIKAELGRVVQFANLSINRHDSYNTLKDILNRYNLEYLL